MKLKRFTIGIIVRLVLIQANLLIFAIIFAQLNLIFNQLILASVLIIQIYELYTYINRTNRELSRFLAAIKFADYNATFQDENLGSSFRELSEAFTVIMGQFKQIKIEKEAHFQYLQLLVEHVNAGIISIDGEGNLLLLNKVAQELLEVPRFNKWEDLAGRHPKFSAHVNSKTSSLPQIVSLPFKEGHHKQFSVRTEELTLLEKTLTVITFQDIKSELEQNELEAYYKLIRVLTHEIMNSVTPVASLTESVQMMLEDQEGKQKPIGQLDDAIISDVRVSLETIERRSVGLLKFVDDYRRLTKLPTPNFEHFEVSRLFNRVETLFSAELIGQKITVTKVLQPNNLKLRADFGLIEQVIINLFTNSLHALKQQTSPSIRLEALKQGLNKVVLSITDNGIGIPADKIEEIFIPFYTSKANGSGIGLSLSQRIMHLHHGKLTVSSEEGSYTKFTLVFIID